MGGIVELCVKGELYFFENTFTDSELKEIEMFVKTIAPEEFNIDRFRKDASERLSLDIHILSISRVIAT